MTIPSRPGRPRGATMWVWLNNLIRGGRRAAGYSATTARGAAGERTAAVWLERERGFRTIARNWRNPQDEREELDLVCRDSEVLVFVEVKTRAPGALVSGYHAVNQRKRDTLRRAALAYLRRLPPPMRPRTFRFDVVEVESVAKGGSAATTVRHFENVPLFRKHDRP